MSGNDYIQLDLPILQSCSSRRWCQDACQRTAWVYSWSCWRKF